jgi:hypothetical protein
MVVRCLALHRASTSFPQVFQMDLFLLATTFFKFFFSLKQSSLSCLSFAVSTLPCHTCTASAEAPSSSAAHYVGENSMLTAGLHMGNVSDISISRKDMMQEKKPKIRCKPCNSRVKLGKSATSFCRPNTQTMASTEQTQREGNAGENIEGKQQIYINGEQRGC